MHRLTAGRPGERNVAGGVLLLAAVLMGVSVAMGGTMLEAALALLGIAALAMADRTVRVVAVALLLVALLNGLPFVDLAALNASGSFNYEDPVFALLLAVGVQEFLRDRTDAASVIPRWLFVTLLFFTFVWGVGVVVAIGKGVPVLKAVLFGRDLLGIWLLAVLGVVAKSRRDLLLIMWIAIGASCLYSVGHIVQVGFGVNMDFITHPRKTTEAFGFARLYSRMVPLTVVSFFGAVGYALWGEVRFTRGVAFAAVAVLGAEQLLQLTRANYFAVSVALCVGTLVAFASRSVRWGVGRTGKYLTGLIVAVVAGYAVSLSSLSRSPIWLTVQNRIASALGEVSSVSGNFGYRLALYDTMLSVLGGSWLLGLGFLHPEYYWIAGLPDGSIRNSDVGMMSVLLPMGIAGVAPLLGIVIGLAWSSGAELRTTDATSRMMSWVCLCICVIALVTAPTLGYLSTLPGLTGTSVAIGMFLRARLVAGRQDDAAQTD
jgi:hypothetical protein